MRKMRIPSLNNHYRLRAILASIIAHPIHIAILSILVVGCVWAFRTINVWATPHNFYQFGVVGITRGQTVRLNVANSSVDHPIQLELSIVDSNNKTLAQSVETVEPSQARYLDLNADTIINTEGERVLVQAVVRDLRSLNTTSNDIIPTFEIFDTTSGKTLTLYAPPINEIYNQDVLSHMSGMLGIGQGQTARLTVTYSYLDNPVAPPVKVQMVFLNDKGETLAKTIQLLSPGTTSFLDLRAYKLNIAEGQRQQIRVVVSPVNTPDSHHPVFLPTLELFTTRTGSTDVLYPSVLKQQVPNQTR